MTIEELEQVIQTQESHGLNNAVLKMPAPKFKSSYPLRVRTPFGLCRWYHLNEGIAIYPTLEQLRNYVAKAKHDAYEAEKMGRK